MHDDEQSVSMSIPLDSDGFLRRECPTCEREFKWLNTPDGEGTPAADGGYFCPYCGVQAEPHTWLTHAQVEMAENIVAREVVAPMLEDLGRDFRRIGQGSGGLIRTELKYDEPNELDPLTEVDDMVRVDFECHPLEPVKVVENWDKPISCLICGLARSE